MDSQRNLSPFSPSWSFQEMVERVSERYRPGSIVSGRARNAVIEAWAIAVGGTRASAELEACIRAAGSKTAAARRLQMSSSTLTYLREMFSGLPDPPAEVRDGLLLFFGERLRPVERWLVEALVIAVLGATTECRLVEIVETDDGQMLRFANATAQELRQVGQSLWDKVWRSSEVRLAPDDAALRSVTQQDAVLKRLDSIREMLERIELRTPSIDALEMLDDQGQSHIRRKDAQSVQTWGQRAASVLGKAVKKKILGEATKEVDGILKDLRPGDDQKSK